ncbi:4Fe-4S dicluster domain-containing protein [Moritella sp. Urea-trap-13]|uniref:4Fe-4S dicluster domain-containing protein n=1 Tax=Moritella sp. Urea-trap-13 TaxID=2058327 RepID=UPI000C3285DF|nr:4Fe-4S dicluster domain-containing protein [Moritella sp. Urea-trap-13]PKH06181.1 hypothetical protein CXF93_09635 [Moritella sp. Urea-trap-13]
MTPEIKGYLIDNLCILQHHLAEHYQFNQVIKDSNQQCYWQQIDNGATAPLLTDKPLSSPKAFFFAERENLLIFDGQCFRETLPTPAPFVLFGVQSCDLTAISYQDQFFKDDPYYQARRNQCLLVGVDCIHPCENGFCPTVDAGPGVRINTADLILHPLPDDNWFLLATTDKGKEALLGLELGLELAYGHYMAQREASLQQCESEFPSDVHITAGIKQLNSNTITATFWDTVAIQCLACSGCTSLCPTCSCYSTRDIETAGKVTQQRFWDSCLYEGFQREASFNNPSVNAGARVQRFWNHKFSDAFVSEFGRYGCVGCGRCEQTCPGVIGVHSIMKRIEKNA